MKSDMASSSHYKLGTTFQHYNEMNKTKTSINRPHINLLLLLGTHFIILVPGVTELRALF